jgi:hypothetical protein
MAGPAAESAKRHDRDFQKQGAAIQKPPFIQGGDL